MGIVLKHSHETLATSPSRFDDRAGHWLTAVIRRGSRDYCILQNGPGLEARNVRAGPSNGKFTVIEEGLQEGDIIVLGPGRYLKQVALPESALTSNLPGPSLVEN